MFEGIEFSDTNPCFFSKTLRTFLPTMAQTISKPTSTLLIYFAIFFFSTYVTAETPVFSRNLSPSSLGLKQEKLSHFHFYFHDIITGTKPTAVRVAQAATTDASSTSFGAVYVIDDPLTILPDNTSKVVGRAQGIYALAAQSEAALLMLLNLAFTEGKYNGSTLSVLGRDAVLSTVREMPIIGGSGVFRFARGYAQARTNVFDAKTKYAILEFDVYVLHYWAIHMLLGHSCFFFFFWWK